MLMMFFLQSDKPIKNKMFLNIRQETRRITKKSSGEIIFENIINWNYQLIVAISISDRFSHYLSP